MKEEVFKKYAKTINKGKVKCEMKNENKEHKTKNETKEIKFTKGSREDVKMINADDTSKHDHSGH